MDHCVLFKEDNVWTKKLLNPLVIKTIQDLLKFRLNYGKRIYFDKHEEIEWHGYILRPEEVKDCEYVIDPRYIEWEKIKNDGYDGVVFEFNNVNQLTQNPEEIMMFTWHNFNKECLIYWKS